MLATARTAILRAEQAAQAWFGRLPRQRCAVEAVPAIEAPGASAAYYVPPDLDGTRAGTYFANTDRATEREPYSSGRLDIQRIRTEAERALGPLFDIKAFHDTVLESGPLPPGVLDDVVRAWTLHMATPPQTAPQTAPQDSNLQHRR